jgi:hypothetical protein
MQLASGSSGWCSWTAAAIAFFVSALILNQNPIFEITSKLHESKAKKGGVK